MLSLRSFRRLSISIRDLTLTMLKSTSLRTGPRSFWILVRFLASPYF